MTLKRAEDTAAMFLGETRATRNLENFNLHKQSARAYLRQLRGAREVLARTDASLADHGQLSEAPLLQGTVRGRRRVPRDEALEIKHLAPVYWPFAFQHCFTDVV